MSAKQNKRAQGSKKEAGKKPSQRKPGEYKLWVNEDVMSIRWVFRRSEVALYASDGDLWWCGVELSGEIITKIVTYYQKNKKITLIMSKVLS